MTKRWPKKSALTKFEAETFWGAVAKIIDLEQRIVTLEAKKKVRPSLKVRAS